MPNVCVNELTITGPKKELDRFLEAAKGDPELYWSEETPFSLQSLVPLPDHIDIKDVDIPSDLALDERWYTWCMRNWGTKWDVMETYHFKRHTDRRVLIAFGTALGPPIEAFTNKIALEFPTLTFTLRFEEEGMSISGECTWRGGQLVREKKLPSALGFKDNEDKLRAAEGSSA